MVPPSRNSRVAAVVVLVALGAAAALGLSRLGSTDKVGAAAPSALVPAPSAPEATPAPPGGTEVVEPEPPSSPSDVEPAARPRPSTTASAEAVKEVDLLKQANDLRRAGDFAGAEALYRQVIQRFPQTTSAYVAMSSVASLLSGRDPGGAIEMYRAARRARPSGSLDLEIRQGLARAYRKRGQTADERRELQELVARYPATESTERAKARLVELSGAPH